MENIESPKGQNVYNQYFEFRNVSKDYYSKYKLPKYISKSLPAEKKTEILDIGCGFGQMLLEIKKMGYANLCGVDTLDEAVKICNEKGIPAIQINDLNQFCISSSKKYDFIIMSHVLEHIEKTKAIETLSLIKKHLLNPNGSFLIMVPNAQSHTGSYWAYEDFTHYTLYTSGSLFYALRAAGFSSVEFVDKDGTAGLNPVARLIIKCLLTLYKINFWFWNKVTFSSFHRPSAQIFSFEIKALAK